MPTHPPSPLSLHKGRLLGPDFNGEAVGGPREFSHGFSTLTYRTCFKDHLQMWQIGWCIRPGNPHPSCKPPPFIPNKNKGIFKITLMTGIQGFSRVTSSHFEGFFHCCVLSYSTTGMSWVRCTELLPETNSFTYIYGYINIYCLYLYLPCISTSTLLFSIHVWYINRYFPWKSTIHVGKYSIYGWYWI